MDPTTIAFWLGQSNAQINSALTASLAGTAPLSPAALQAMLLSRSVDIGNARAALLYGNSVGGVHSWRLAEDLSAGSILPNGTREIAVFSQTEMGQLRNSTLFNNAVRHAHGFDQSAINNFFGTGPTPGLDDAMSRAYVSNLRVPVITITGPDSDPGRVFGRTEVPAILNNPNIPSVDGISRADLVQRFQGSNLIGRNGATDVFEMIKARSFDNMVHSGASIGLDASGNARFAPNAAFLSRAGAANVTPRPNLPDVPNGTRSFGALSDNALASLGRGARYLDFLGTVGDVLEGVLVLNTARELLQAGDSAGAAQAIAEWGGGLAGGAIGVSLVAPLAAGLAATGVGAVGSVALLVAAGVAGSIAGEQAVRTLISNLDNIGAFFGEAYDNISDFLVNGGNAAADFLAGLTDYAADITGRVADFGVDLAFGAVDAVMGLLRDASDAINELGGDVASTLNRIGDALGDIGQSLSDLFSSGVAWIDQAGNSFADALRDQLRRLIDPLVLDLDGNGIELTPRTTSNVYFDMDGDGIKELTGWVKPTDGLLAIDSNTNGQIDNINELIGDLNRSGFAELITYDLNNDKIINANDSIWSKLRIWLDTNSNGITDTGELRTLNSYSIRSIDLRYTAVNFTAEGNRIHEQSIFEYTNGTTGLIADIWFDVSNVDTNSSVGLTGNLTIDKLPDIRGRGDVRSLRTAMLADAALATLVTGFVIQNPSSLVNTRSQVEQIIYRWSGVQSVDPSSRGGLFDGRRLAALEAFLGTPFLVQGNRNPNAQAVTGLSASWNSLVEGVMSRLLMSGPLGSAIANSAVYVPEIDRLLTVQTPSQLLSTFRSLAPTGDGLTVAGYWAAVLPLAREIIQNSGGDPSSSAFTTAVTNALQATGLAPFSDLLNNGILPLGTIPSMLQVPGVYRLSSNNDGLWLNQDRHAVYSGDGDDFVAVEPSWAQTQLIDGGSGNDQLFGGSSDDWIDGGSGADTLAGGGGNDTYTVDDVGDVVVEAPGAGDDHVRSTITYSLANDLEHLTLLGTNAINGTGNASANRISGNNAANRLEGLTGHDTLDGGAGADTMVGGLGADLYRVDASGDVIIETGTDIDTVEASVNYTLGARVENLVLIGT
ncbi:MAG: hypothetical protein ACK46L_03400, partial [Synechococcaceae cyanobacterium]